MDVAFVPAALKRCALHIFGTCDLLEGKEPPYGNHLATQKWFQLIFAARVVDADKKVSGFDYRVEGFRVCAGAFRAAYAIPQSTHRDMAQAVREGHHAWTSSKSTGLPRAWR
eukprot:3393331-Pleurochrysis_carterae.AAC.1